MNREERDEMRIYDEMSERLNSSLKFSGLRYTEGAISYALMKMKRAGVKFTLKNFKAQIISDFATSSLWSLKELAEEMGVYEGDSLASVANCIIEKAIKSGVVNKEEK